MRRPVRGWEWQSGALSWWRLAEMILIKGSQGLCRGECVRPVAEALARSIRCGVAVQSRLPYGQATAGGACYALRYLAAIPVCWSPRLCRLVRCGVVSWRAATLAACAWPLCGCVSPVVCSDERPHVCMCVHVLAPPAPIAVRFELVCVGGRHTYAGVSDVPHGLPWPAASPCAILVHVLSLPCSGVARQGAATTTSCTTSS